MDELISFFNDEAVYIDGPRGVHRGIEAIRSEFASQVQMVPSTTVDIKIPVANGGAVAGNPIEHEEVGVFEIDGDGRITRWRDYYDLNAVAERVATANASST